MASQSQAPGPGGSQGSSQGEGKTEREWKLRDCTMSLGSFSKRSPTDAFMTLDLVFCFPDDPVPKIVELPYNIDTLKNAWINCNNALETVVFLEDCSYKEQKSGFVELIYQEIAAFKAKVKNEASQGVPPVKSKKTLKFYKPTVECFEDICYLIAAEIFCITGVCKKLTVEERNRLPILVSWKGGDCRYELDQEQCIRLLTRIFFDTNLMQNRRFASFPLAVFVAHLAGMFYRHIIKRQGNFCTQMSISGDSCSTGKSLMQTVMMLAFEGEEKPTTTSMTETNFFETLDAGNNIYVKEFSVKKMSSRSNTIDGRFLGAAVEALWERAQKGVRGKNARPDAVIHVDGNLVPKDLKPYMKEATWNKIRFNYTGPDPLEHEQESKLVKRILKNAKDLHKFLPVLLNIGEIAVLNEVTDEEVAALEGALKRPKDRKEAQTLANYDRVYSIVEAGIVKYNLPRPLLFQSDADRRTSLTFFNKNEEEKERIESVCRKLIQILETNRGVHLVERSDRAPSFKVKFSDQSLFDPFLLKDLKQLKSSSHTTFDGIKQRVVVLMHSAMAEDTIKDMQCLTCRWSSWSRLDAAEEKQEWASFGDRFCDRVLDTMQKDSVLADEFSNDGDEEDVRGESDEDALVKKKSAEVLNSDESSEELEESQQEGVYMCEKPSCREYGTTFKFPSGKAKHDRTSYHENAKGNSSKLPRGGDLKRKNEGPTAKRTRGDFLT